MKSLAMPCYAGLLTAAQYHGAAHQRPQEFMVFLEKRRLAIECGKVRVAFLIRKRLREVPVQALNTPRGSLLLSTPEATAVDLVGYQHQAGGLDQVATVLSELAEKIDPQKLAAAAATAAVPWAQRLGYLLEHVGAADRVAPLKEYVRARAHESALLLDPWLGKPKWKQTDGRVTFVYRFASEDSPPLALKLKVETVACKEMNSHSRG
jgi:predicted transcriptional regulator of viral defense system